MLEYNKGVMNNNIEDFENVAGMGLVANVNGEKINTDGIESIYIRDEDRISVEINR